MFTFRNSKSLFWTWTWLCFFYALVIVALGLVMPFVFGWDLVRNSEGQIEYIGFYITLYIIAISCFILYHIQAGSLQKLFYSISNKFVHLKQFFKRLFYRRQLSISPSTDHSHDDIFYESEEEEYDKCHVKEIGKHGLKFGVKVSTIVFLIVIIVELSYYIQARMLADSDCDLDEIGIFIILQFIFVILQAHFILTAQKEHVENHKHLAIFGFAHIAASTTCTGLFITWHDDILKLYPLYKMSLTNLEHYESGKNESKSFEESHEPKDSPHLESDYQYSERIRRSVPDFKVNINKSCSLTSYINESGKQIKPFTFQLSMFYIYCSIIIFVLLFLHLRKSVSSPKNSPNSIFKYAPGRGATFSSSAGLSLVILGVITSLLTLNSENNYYAIIFLLFLHTQASVVGLIALCKIIYVPCTRKESVGKSHVIFLFFYFFIITSVIFKIISKSMHEEHNGSSEMVIEIAEALLDLIQLFLQGLLILIGFHVDVNQRILRRRIMPCHILIHLAATNLSDLISNIFRKRTADYFTFTKEDHGGGHNGDHEMASVNNLFTTQMASIILGSVLVPCISFHRFYSIICMVKLHKAWSIDENRPLPKPANEIEESHL